MTSRNIILDMYSGEGCTERASRLYDARFIEKSQTSSIKY